MQAAMTGSVITDHLTFRGQFELVLIPHDEPRAMLDLAGAYRASGCRFAVDPTGQLARMSGAELRSLVDGAELVFVHGNDLDLLLAGTRWSEEQLLWRIGSLVTNLGAGGVRVSAAGTEPVVVAACPVEVANTVAPLCLQDDNCVRGYS